jgi:hypothetical protein
VPQIREQGAFLAGLLADHAFQAVRRADRTAVASSIMRTPIYSGLPIPAVP